MTNEGCAALRAGYRPVIRREMTNYGSAGYPETASGHPARQLGRAAAQLYLRSGARRLGGEALPTTQKRRGRAALAERFVHAAAIREDHADQAVHALRVGQVMSDSIRSFLLWHYPDAIEAGRGVGRGTGIEVVGGGADGVGDGEDVSEPVGVVIAESVAGGKL
jgi:hypothetical protein